MNDDTVICYNCGATMQSSNPGEWDALYTCPVCGDVYDPSYYPSEEFDYPDDDAQDPDDGNWCPECGELRELCQCDKSDGDTCSHCGSSNTERIDTISSEPVIWVCQCGSCGETFELLVSP